MNESHSNDYLCLRSIRETLNRVTNLLLLLMVTSFILPTSAIRYASGTTTDNDTSSSGESNNNNTALSSGKSNNNNTALSSGESTTDNNAAGSTGGSTASNNTGNTADLANSILAVHNSERAAVGVPPLVWSDELAAGAQTWAEHLATTGEFAHDPNRPNGVGENIAGFNPSKGVSAPGEGQSLWVDEKKNWHGGVLTPENWSPTGHYTQMVWKDTKQVGCGTASGDGHPFSILVCRYSPPGNFMGQAPY